MDWSTLHKVLRDETRKKIILTLNANRLLTYTDLMNRLEITNTGSLNYHLKKLNDLLMKDGQGAYTLTEKGRAAAELLEKLPSQIPTTKALRTSGAVLIGFLGFLLILLPAYTAVLGIAQTLSFLFAGMTIFILYPLFVPSFAMWGLTARRTKAHDLYDFMKPPVIAAGMFYLLQIILFVIERMGARATTPPPQPITTTTQTSYFIALPSYVFLPWIPLIGVLIIEGLYRVRSH